MDGARVDDESPGDDFEFDLTRVLESLEQRGPTLGELSALSTRHEPAPVVDTAGSPAPLLITPLSDDEPVPLPPRPLRAPVVDPAAGAARAEIHGMPIDTDVVDVVTPALSLPTPLLPPPAVAAAPSAAAADRNPVKVPTAAEVRRFQASQQRQARKNSQGRVMGRAMLVLVLCAAAVAAALTVGPGYLFPDDWAAELDEPVAAVQAARGTEFQRVVPLTDEAADDYAATIARIVLGDDPDARVAMWRALGVASGEVDPASLGAALAPTQPAVYDAQNAVIVRLAGATPDLRPLLAAALDHQLTEVDSGALDVLGPPPLTAVAAFGTAETDPAPPSGAPGDPAAIDTALPVMYQARAGERIAPALAANPTASLGDAIGAAPEATLAPGDVPSAGPFSLGIDDWTLVWRNRLSADSVATLVAATSADSVRTFERAGTPCVGAVFEAGNEMYAAALSIELGTWAAAGPVESQASVTQLAPTSVQLTTCDPGAAVVQGLNPAAVEEVVAAQLARIAAANPVAASATTTP